MKEMEAYTCLYGLHKTGVKYKNKILQFFNMQIAIN